VWDTEYYERRRGTTTEITGCWWDWRTTDVRNGGMVNGRKTGREVQGVKEETFLMAPMSGDSP
jgi:hypothetical protein